MERELERYESGREEEERGWQLARKAGRTERASERAPRKINGDRSVPFTVSRIPSPPMSSSPSLCEEKEKEIESVAE